MTLPADARPGRLLDGRYRVGAVIARGGMSTVFRGVDTRLDRAVAIKVMHPGYAGDPSFLTRFEREARLAAGLHHPGVVAVYDQGRDDDVVFLVMELVDGGTLRDLLRQRGPLPVPVAVSVLEPLLGALATAHAAGLVHRDVKPENVLISGRGEVKVADFGLVRAVTSQTMATGDVILGTVAYLSPEQVATGASDPRSDVYAAGVVAYEMLTGAPPFTGDNPMSVAYQHVHSDVPPVTDRAPGVPVELDDLLLAATCRDPDARPRDAGAFVASLVGVRRRLGIRLQRVPTPQLDRPTPDATGAAGGGNPVGAGPRPSPGTPATGSARTRRADRPPAPRQATLAAPTVAPARPVDRPGRGTAPAPRSPLATGGGRAGRRWRRWLIAVVILLLLGTAAALGGWWLGSGRWAYMPRTVGLQQVAAESVVRGAGLVPDVHTAFDDDVPAGSVARADPAAGTRALRGTQVDLVVSTGRPRVPAVRAGSSVAQAEAALARATLRARFDPAADRYDDRVPAGAVLGTDPVAGTAVPVSAAVTVVRSLGPAPVPVPAVAGKSPEDARNALLAAGFLVGATVPTFDPSVPDGAVVGSRPAAGVPTPRGTTVSLLTGHSLLVPPTQGRSVADATARLTAAGFTVSFGDRVFDPDAEGGSVSGTVPTAGSRVDPADPRVVLHLSSAVTVPPLVGRSVQEAEDALRTAGLAPVVVAMVGSGSSRVVDQSPEPGVRVAPGSSVGMSAFP
ncbi:Stk1 family PASTA domain-containing Ser/Thr kinase [Nakamurella endophytica]|uniref:non-specific serine/threonine protein kinase n=1 Tax=Nakamurella endophytica TaxID=1748367 RepID=A0A917T9C2_9ACTN|nr:Stk1 family PASTA domain-containing Ser/Thr kinase [Nakamurella endophytica]GGM12462.1 serine/threonine protein kinase [Nakamurella endophytica]